MKTITESEFSKKLENSFRLANVLADAVEDFAKENPDGILMEDLLAALAATTANFLVLCKSKEKAMSVLETHTEVTRDLILKTPDYLFGLVGDDDPCV